MFSFYEYFYTRYLYNFVQLMFHSQITSTEWIMIYKQEPAQESRLKDSLIKRMLGKFLNIYNIIYYKLYIITLYIINIYIIFLIFIQSC